MEINSDVGFGVTQIVFNIFLLLQSLFTESLFTFLGYSGFFYGFGCVMVISVIYFCIYVGETKHLTDKEKKELFVPGGKYGRKLRPGEEQLAEPKSPMLTQKESLYGIGNTDASVLTKESNFEQ